MEAILLAGGLGTRLHEVTGDRYPKCLARVNQKPFLHYVIEFLRSEGVTHFIFAISHHAELVREEVEKSFPKLSCDFSYEDTPRGTGGAINQALKHVKGDFALVLNADSYVEVKVCDFVSFCRDRKAKLGVVCTEVDNIERFGAADIKESQLVGFHEKGRKGKGHINAGLYYIDKHLEILREQPIKFSFELEVLSSKRVNAFAYLVDGLFFDIGTPDDLSGASQLVAQHKALFGAK